MKRSYTCGCCGRRLKHEHWIYSRHTGNRYCWPGEGCNVRAHKKRQKARQS